MNLKDFTNLVSFFVKANVEPERLQDVYNNGQLSQYYKCFTVKDWESLRPFSVAMDGGLLPLLHFTNGRAPIPIDYEGNPQMLTPWKKKVNIVDDEEYQHHIESAIEYPDENNVIANFKSNFIRIEPKTVKYLNFTYVAKPKPIVFGYKTGRGFVEYDSVSSTELLWNDQNIIQIIILVLQSFGVVASQEEVKSQINNQNPKNTQP